MNKPTLVIMAAGMGSRFGGSKQLTPVDDAGHLIIDFSIYDALRAGFEKIICVIKPEMEEAFHAAIGERIARHAALEYAYQSIDRLPDGYSVPEGRVKPWGTAHAVLCAAKQIPGAFAAINADDYYGPTAFKAAADFLTSEHSENSHAMVGYRIENTLTENGYVSRGVCLADESGALRSITERLHIEPRPNGAAYIEGDAPEVFIPCGTLVSMNLWAFSHSILDEMKARFKLFLDSMPDPIKSEYYLPSVPDALIREGKAHVRLLETQEKWYGVTYHDDLAAVQTAMCAKREAGIYPDRLWS